MKNTLQVMKKREKPVVFFTGEGGLRDEKKSECASAVFAKENAAFTQAADLGIGRQPGKIC